MKIRKDSIQAKYEQSYMLGKEKMGFTTML
jgi:hypothetical protein